MKNQVKKGIFLFILFIIQDMAFGQTYLTKNVVVVTLDGFRWQEVFRGADTALINSRFTSDKNGIRKKFDGTSAQDKRMKLLPFFWTVLGQQGQLYGNRDLGNLDEVANPYYFSYPGYNEIFTGFPDPRMNTNNGILNPNKNVLEYINAQNGFQNKVAVFSSWERFPQIFNVARSQLMVNSGYMDFTDPNANGRFTFLNKLQKEVPKILGDSTRLDFLTYEMGLNYLNEYKPRVLYISFDETDEYAHQGKYDNYLNAAHVEDGMLNEIWNYIQSNPNYANKTTLIITCDHGRGAGQEKGDRWTDHGKGTPNSNQTWFAVIGPDTPAAGEISTHTKTFHKQLAQTISLMLGLNFAGSTDHEVGSAIATVAKK